MKENETQTTLSSEKLGDEKRIRAVLAGWGMNSQAVERMLDQHRALRAKARQERRGRALGNHRGIPASSTSHGAHQAH